MFKTLKQLFTKKNKDIRKRVYFTLAVLTLFVIGTTIEVPGTQEITKSLGFLELLDVMGGGALSNFSIFALGVTPYITASIVIQLLQMDIIPYFADLAKQGPAARQKINKITRYLGIVFAFIQGYAMAYAFLGSGVDVAQRLEVAFIMTAGTAFLLWLGDQVSQQGIGNGVSLLIMAGIIQSMPSMFVTTFQSLVTSGSYSTVVGSLLFALFVMVYILIILGVVFIQLAERRVPIQYSNRTNSAYGAQTSYLPIKLNAAGVMPVIFASTLITIPTTIVNLIGNESAINFVNNYIVYTSPTGFLLYVVLILFFGYFYTFMEMNPEEMSKNLNKNGGYIPGVRPGADTTDYISKVIGRLTIVGSIFLVIIAGLPIIFSKFSGLPSSVTIGGTGLLIVVGVAIETYKQLESSLVSRSYREGRRHRR